MGLLAGQRDHNNRRTTLRCSQQGSRFPVASSERLKRMELGFQSFSNNIQEAGASTHKSFCFHNFSSGPNIHIMEVGLIQNGKGGFSNNMDPSKIICFPSFCTNKWSLEQSAKIESKFVANCPSLVNTIMVSTAVTTHSANTIASTKNQNLLLGPNRVKHPFIEQGNLELLAWIVSGKDYMQKELRKTLPLLSQMSEDQVQMLITNRLGVSSAAGVLKDRLISLSVL